MVWYVNNSGMGLFKTFLDMCELKPEYKKKKLQEEIEILKDHIEFGEETLLEKKKLLKEKEKQLSAL